MTYQYSEFLSTCDSIDLGIVENAPREISHESFIMIPEEIVAFCCQHFGLTSRELKGIDPMCGYGTIPKVVNEMGGSCIGIEIDKDKCDYISKNVPKFELICDDYRECRYKDIFDYAFTSMPFELFNSHGGKMQVSSSYAEVLSRFIKETGVLLLDSVLLADRGRGETEFAKLQFEYLVQNGFVPKSGLLFTTQHMDEEPVTSIIMEFGVMQEKFV